MPKGALHIPCTVELWLDFLTVFFLHFQQNSFSINRILYGQWTQDWEWQTWFSNNLKFCHWNQKSVLCMSFDCCVLILYINIFSKKNQTKWTCMRFITYIETTWLNRVATRKFIHYRLYGACKHRQHVISI